MPAVAVCSRPSGLPTASTASPTESASLSPSGSGLAAGWRARPAARRGRGGVDRRGPWPCAHCDRERERHASASSTTWAFVRTCPRSSIRKPDRGRALCCTEDDAGGRVPHDLLDAEAVAVGVGERGIGRPGRRRGRRRRAALALVTRRSSRHRGRRAHRLHDPRAGRRGEPLPRFAGLGARARRQRRQGPSPTGSRVTSLGDGALVATSRLPVDAITASAPRAPDHRRHGDTARASPVHAGRAWRPLAPSPARRAGSPPSCAERGKAAGRVGVLVGLLLRHLSSRSVDILAPQAARRSGALRAVRDIESLNARSARSSGVTGGSRAARSAGR